MHVPMAEKFSLIRQMQDTFGKAAKDRRNRSDLVADPLDPSWQVFGWQLFERETMHAAVNAERSRRGLPPVDIKFIVRADRLAAGHSDYGTKFPLYCTEIALGEDSPQA